MSNEKTNDEELLNRLMGLPLLRDMDLHQIKRLLDLSSKRELAVGEVLCNPETIDDRLLVLVEGKLRLESNGGEKLAEIAPPRIVGEMGVLTGQSRQTRLVVQEASVAFELEAGQLQSLLEEDPEIISHMQVSLIKGLYERIGGMNEDIKKLQDQTSRLRSRLSEVAPGDPLLAEISS